MKEYSKLERELSALFQVPLSIFDGENYVRLPDDAVTDEIVKKIVDKLGIAK